MYVVLKVHVESKGAVDRKGLQFFYFMEKNRFGLFTFLEKCGNMLKERE